MGIRYNNINREIHNKTLARGLVLGFAVFDYTGTEAQETLYYENNKGEYYRSNKRRIGPDFNARGAWIAIAEIPAEAEFIGNYQERSK